jgi:hypothetical protein
LVWIDHVQGEHLRHNRHILAWGREKLDLGDLNEYWIKIYSSFMTWRKKRAGGIIVGDAEACAGYLAEYFAGAGYIGSRFSYNWVFPGWFEFCRWERKHNGAFPSISLLAQLAGVSAIGRLAVPEYRLWYESTQDKVKQAIADRLLGKSDQEASWLSEYQRRHHTVRKLVHAIS